MLNNNQQISEVMVKAPEVQAVLEDDCFHDAIEILNKNKWGAVFVVDKKNILQGILTDGDVRRILVKNQEPMAQLNAEPVSKYMIRSFTTVEPSSAVIETMKMLNDKGFLCAPVVDKNNGFVGVVHLQHLVKEVLRAVL
jgi:arabinose-5-phosphate isomerase